MYQSYMYLSSATQMWCLARLLPLIIGSEIPTDNGHWYNFLLLLEMLDYIFAPTITPTAVAQLKVLINEHHILYNVGLMGAPTLVDLPPLCTPTSTEPTSS